MRVYLQSYVLLEKQGFYCGICSAFLSTFCSSDGYVCEFVHIANEEEIMV